MVWAAAAATRICLVSPYYRPGPCLGPRAQDELSKPCEYQGCGAATRAPGRFRGCRTYKKIKNSCFHLVTRRPVAPAGIYYTIRRNTKFVLRRLHAGEMQVHVDSTVTVSDAQSQAPDSNMDIDLALIS